MLMHYLSHLSSLCFAQIGKACTMHKLDFLKLKLLESLVMRWSKEPQQKIYNSSDVTYTTVKCNFVSDLFESSKSFELIDTSLITINWLDKHPCPSYR